VYDYEEPLGGSYLLEAATLIPVGKVAKGGKLLERGITVLSHKPEYLERAAELGARYLKVPDEIWEKWSDAERWAANSRFLDRAIARGDEFILATRGAQQERAVSLRDGWSDLRGFLGPIRVREPGGLSRLVFPDRSQS
jgi:hypothetical protein